MELSLKEATEALGISLSTARRWVKTGRLRAVIREGPTGRNTWSLGRGLSGPGGRTRRQSPSSPPTHGAARGNGAQGVAGPSHKAGPGGGFNTLAQMTRSMEGSLWPPWSKGWRRPYPSSGQGLGRG
ncbi:MAG: helix-turn-helix domain-containing protein [Synergistales bacterium]|nr:helix-turn-helix domain-containing protein [Synergistales bacterium]